MMATQGIEALFSGSWSEDYLLRELPGVTNLDSLSDLQPYLLPGSVAYAGGDVRLLRSHGVHARLRGGGGRQEAADPGADDEAAIGVLAQDDDGFFLMVEQATLDYGGHSRDPGWVGADMNDLDRAVKAAYDWAEGRSDTLIVVTGDHETGGLDVTPDTDYAAIKPRRPPPSGCGA